MARAAVGGGERATRALAPVFDRRRAKWGGGGAGRPGGARAGAVETPMRGGTRGRGGGGSTRTSAPCWIRPPGTRFIVDGFEWDLGRGGACETWFLTHFHADHHRGLTKTFDKGIIYGTKETLELVRMKIQVPALRLRALEIGVPARVDGVQVTFIDANHCPGAVMILFEFPGRSDASPVLHTGDFRFSARLARDDTLARIAASPKRPILILDTTYCSLEHDAFPTQEYVLNAVRDALTHEDNLDGARKLFLFGTYTVGKEKVFFEAARTLGRKVYVGAAKWSVLDALSLTRDEREALTRDDKRTNLHVVPMGSTSFSKMASILKYYKSRFDTVVAFRPTGWTFSANKKTSRASSRRQRGRLVQYGLPYSEHSSLSELRAFIRFINPRSIFPHVGNDGGEKLKDMLKLLRASDEEYAAMREEYTASMPR